MPSKIANLKGVVKTFDARKAYFVTAAVKRLIEMAKMKEKLLESKGSEKLANDILFRDALGFGLVVFYDPVPEYPISNSLNIFYIRRILAIYRSMRFCGQDKVL